MTSDSSTAVKICPRCGLVAAPDARLCDRCFTSLAGVEAVSREVAQPRIAAEEAEARTRARLITAPSRAVAVFVVAFLAVFLLARDALPAVITGTSTRTGAALAGAAWSGAGGGAAGARATSGGAHLARLGGASTWTVTFDAEVLSLAADAERVYVSLTDARLVALDARTGEERWTLPVPGQLDHPPVIAGDRLYLSFRNARVIAVDAATGTERWTHTLPGVGALLAPVVHKGLAWVASDALVALDVEDGTVRHYADLPETTIVAPVVAGERLALATSSEQRVYDLATGEPGYHYPLRAIRHLAAIDGTTVILGERTMIAADAGSKQAWWDGPLARRLWAQVWLMGMAPSVPPPRRDWIATLPAPAFAPALDAERVYVADHEGALRAYRLADGSTLWERDDLGASAAPLLTADGLLALTAAGLVLLDPVTGEERERRVVERLRLAIATEGGLYLATGGEGVPDGVSAFRD